MSGIVDCQGSQGTKKKPPGCYHCTKRRINCDGAKPQCAKCLRKGLKCPGYGIRYRFAPNSTVRGKSSGTAGLKDDKLAAEVGLRGTSPLNLSWPEEPTTSTLNLAPTLPSARFEAEYYDRDLLQAPDATFIAHDIYLPLGSPTYPSSASDETDDPRVPSSIAASPTRLDRAVSETHNPDHTLGLFVRSPRVPTSLSLLDPRARELFDHFSSTIAPVMVVVDSEFNGYRNLLLPLACEDELVRAAVCVASLNFLAQQRPEMQRQAELVFQSILGQLRQRTSTRTDLVDVSAWATLIILLTAETITGGTNLPYLFKILQHLADANTGGGRSSVMHTFLAEQTRMMTLFAQPLLEEGTGNLALSHRSEAYFDFVSNVAIFRPDLSKELEIYKTAIHYACNLYITRATYNPPHCETVADLDLLKGLCELILPSTPGHHTLVWVYFIAAAESSTVEHRNFFTTRLQEVFSQSRFRNIPAALDALKGVWEVQSKRRWTEILPEITSIFII